MDKDKSLRRVLLRPGGMGSNQPWQSACFCTASFGDQLGGCTAQLAIQDCFETFVPAETRKVTDRGLCMDDVMLSSLDATRPIEKMITEVDSALLKGNFGVKGWVRTGDKISIKFLSYLYHAERDTFSVKANVNWSPKRRGARQAPNVENVEGLRQHVEMYPLTRRNLASILMGTLYDPLQI